MFTDIVPNLLVSLNVALWAYVALDVGRRWVAMRDRAHAYNERLEALERAAAQAEARNAATINKALGGFLEEIKAAGDRLDKLEQSAVANMRPMGRGRIG